MDPDTPDPTTPLERTDEHAVERHAAFLRRTLDPVGLLFIGDSITRRWVEVPDLWEQCFGRHAPANFGVGGDTTQSVLWRLANGELEGIHPRLVVLLIGTNNLPTHEAPAIASGIRAVVTLLRERLPASPLLVNAILPRGPQDPRKSNGGTDPWYVPRIRAVNAALAATIPGEGVEYLDVGERFLGDDGEIRTDCMADRLHLVRAGYQVWAKALVPIVARHMP